MQATPLFFAGLMPGGGEWLWIFIIVLLLFGASKLPSLAKGMGQAMKEFKKASKDIEESDEKPTEPKKVEGSKPTGTHGSN